MNLVERIVLLVAALTVAFMSAAVANDEFAKAKQAHEAGEYRLAMRLLQPLAEGGDARAQHLLGHMHERGDMRIVPIRKVRFAKARFWYEKSAAQDFTPAIAALGKLLILSFQTPGDKDRGIKLLKVAANRDHIDAQVHYGMAIWKTDKKAGKYWINRAAAQRSWYAAITFVFIYGMIDDESRNFGQAYFWAVIWRRFLVEEIPGAGESDFERQVMFHYRKKVTHHEAAEAERRAAAWLTAHGIAP